MRPPYFVVQTLLFLTGYSCYLSSKSQMKFWLLSFIVDKWKKPSTSYQEMDNCKLHCWEKNINIKQDIMSVFFFYLHKALKDTEIKRRWVLLTSEKNFYSLKREVIALVCSKSILGALKYTKCFESEKIIECELILIKACWSATNRLRGDASKSCCLQFILSIQMRKYLVFN